MKDMIPYGLLILFLLTTLWILLRRDAIKGWYNVATGFVACVAGVVWSFNLSDKELMRVVLDALLWMQLTRPWQTLQDLVRQILPPSLLSPIVDLLRDFFRQALLDYEAQLVPVFLLLTYFFVSRLAGLFLSIFFRLAVNTWLRQHGTGSDLQAAAPQDMPEKRPWMARLTFRKKQDASRPMTLAEAFRGLNAYLAVSSGSRTLRWVLSGLLAFLFLSVISAHQLGSPASGGFDWNPFAVHPQVFWLGLYIFAAELLGQLLKLKRSKPFRRRMRRSERAAVAALPSLVPLYRRGILDHGAYVLAKWQGKVPSTKPAPVSRVSPAPSYLDGDRRKLFALRIIARILRDDAKLPAEVLTRWLADMERFIREPRYMIFHEALHPLHLRILFALCMDQQSRGRISLIICPEHIVKDVELALKECASSSLASLVQRGVVLGGTRGPPLRTEQSYSYVIVADTQVERELLGSGPAAQFVLENLGMIVALEAQDLQVSLLRLRLPRLWLRVPREDEISILVQVGSLDNYVGLAEALLRRSKAYNPFVWSTRFADASSTHTILWRSSQDTAKSIFQKYLSPTAGEGFSTSLSLVTYAMSGSEQAYRPNRAFLNQNEVTSAEDQLANARIAETDQPIASSLKHASSGSEDARKAARVVIVEERVNFLTALARFHDWHRHNEILLNLVVHDYPLRDFHVFRTGGKGLPSDDAQMAPNPRGGVRELVSTLHDALRERRGEAPDDVGLRRSQIVDKFLERLPSRLQSELALVPGVNGFKRLFDQLGSPVPAIKAHREESETRYEIDGGSRDDFPELHFSIPVRVEGKDRLRVPSGDVGLTILPSQTILIEGWQHYVEDISRTHIRCYAQQRPGRDVVFPILEYRWEMLPTKSSTASQPASPVREATSTWLLDRSNNQGGTLWIAHHYGSMTRRTVGRVSFREDVEPLTRREGRQGLITATNFEAAAQHPQRRDYQSILQLKFNYLPDVTQAELPLFAFTTCVVVQDVVRARFPRWPHRINVVSPHAAQVFELCRGDPQRLGLQNPEEKARLSQLLACIYPRLVVEPPEPVLPAEDAARNGKHKVGSFDVYLIEDSDFDLGIARQIQSSPEALLGQIWRYLDWLRQEGFRSRYHRFGAAVESPLLMFERVWMMMDGLPRD
jgi:hypothetical protein